MAQFEYKVVPAPKKGLKARGVKGTEAMFAHALATLMNEAAADGWEYQRTDSLPCEERQGFTGRVTVFQNMLVFRRPVAVAQPAGATVAAAPSVAGPAVAIPSVVTPAAAAAYVPAPSVTRDQPFGLAPALNAPDSRIAQTLAQPDVDEARMAPQKPVAPKPQVAAE